MLALVIRNVAQLSGQLGPKLLQVSSLQNGAGCNGLRPI